MVVDVARDDGDQASPVGRSVVEIIAREPQDPDKRDQRMAITGNVQPGEWYRWHGAYIAPFAYRDRLYVRSFDHLYCFADGDGSGDPR